MGRKSILDTLTDYFDSGFQRKVKREETLKGMKERLQAKRSKLRKRLKNTDSESERKLLKKQVKVLQAQIRKAEKLMH